MKAPTGIVTNTKRSLVKDIKDRGVSIWNAGEDVREECQVVIYEDDLDEVIDFLTAVRDELRAKEERDETVRDAMKPLEGVRIGGDPVQRSGAVIVRFREVIGTPPHTMMVVDADGIARSVPCEIRQIDECPGKKA